MVIEMKRNYVLVDLENVSPNNLNLLTNEIFHVKVFVGKLQNRIPLDIVLAMQNIGLRGEYIQMSGAGKNALDFHIAYYLGVLAQSEPEAYFHIISEDKGFDPLILHMRDSNKFVQRHVDVSEISILKVKATEKELSEADYERIVTSLNKRSHNRPRKTESLGRMIESSFNLSLDEIGVERVLERLVSDGFVVVGEEKSVGYRLQTNKQQG